MTVRLARIDLYPVKSFDAASVESARIMPSGALEYDRRYALFDAAGRVVNGKRTPLVHGLRFEYGDQFEWVEVTNRSTGEMRRYSLNADRAAIDATLTGYFGFSVTLREDSESGFPDDTLASGPTVIAAETLSAVAKWFHLSFEEARKRFRANLVLEGGGAFWDDRLIAQPGETVTFRIGEVLLFGTNPCARCVVPSRDSSSGQQSRGFAKEFALRRQATLEGWAPLEAFDHYYRLAVNTRLFAPNEGGALRIGDPVEVLKSSP